MSRQGQLRDASGGEHCRSKRLLERLQLANGLAPQGRCKVSCGRLLISLKPGLLDLPYAGTGWIPSPRSWPCFSDTASAGSPSSAGRTCRCVDPPGVELVSRFPGDPGGHTCDLRLPGRECGGHRGVLSVGPGPRLTVLRCPEEPRSQPGESREPARAGAPPRGEAEARRPALRGQQASATRRSRPLDQLICFAFHDSETLLSSCRTPRTWAKVVSLLFFD